MEEKEEDAAKESKVKGKGWIVILLLFLALVGIRLYFFFITANDVAFWDETQYLSVAKTYAGQGQAELAGQRLPGFPLLASWFFGMGLSEVAVKFIVCFIPSILLLVLFYFLVKRIYPDKRVAWVSLIVLGVLCENLFWSNRFMTDNFGLIFELSALWFMVNLSERKSGWNVIPFLGFICLAFLFRPGTLVFVPAALLFLMFYAKPIIKWATVLFSVAAIGIVKSVPSLYYIVMSYTGLNMPLAWNSLGIADNLLSPWLNICFYIGMFIAFICLFNKEDKEEHKQDKKWDIFNLLLVLVVMSAFIFIIRAPNYEYRWFFPMLIALICFAAKGLIDIADMISALFGKNSIKKIISVLIILIVLALFCVSQISMADMIMKSKSEAYKGVKDAALWMKDNSNTQDVIFSISKPQTAYYSERHVESYSLLNNTEEMDEFIGRWMPKYLTVSVYEPHPQWIYDWISENNQTVIPIWAEIQNTNPPSPMIVAYRIDYALAKVNSSNLTCDDTCSLEA